MEHVLKTWPIYFQAVADNRKTFEIRKNDRDFKAGDILTLMEYDPDKDSYSGKTLKRRITYILSSEPFVPAGYVCMGIAKLNWFTETALEHKKFWGDCKHIFWLFGVAIKCFLKGDIGGAEEAICWIKIHWNYKSTRIK